jgi:hypothetical protein
VIIFCIHVDDFAIAASHHHLIQQLKDDLRDNGYIITESDTLETFLGVHIHSQRSGIYLSQPGHLAEIFSCAKASDKGADTPMSAEFSDIAQDNSPPSVPDTAFGARLFKGNRVTVSICIL